MTNEELQAQCAALRSALEEMLNEIRADNGESEFEEGSVVKGWCDMIKAALALDAGKGFIPADKARVIAAALQMSLVAPQSETFRQKRDEAFQTAREFGLLSKNPS